MTTKFFNLEELEKYASQVISLINKNHLNYRSTTVPPKDFPPGTLKKFIPSTPPFSPSSFDTILATTETHILPNILKWQHPRFHGYFQSSTSHPVVLAENIHGNEGVAILEY